MLHVTVVAEMFVGLKFHGFLIMDGSWGTQICGKPPKPSLNANSLGFKFHGFVLPTKSM